MGIRLHLCGRLAIEGPDGVVDERELPGRQGRLALARLALERRHPVPIDRLVEAVWSADPPGDAAPALASITSKLRSCFRRAGAGPDVIGAISGCYQLRLPPGSRIDVEDARAAADQAAGARRRDDPGAAWAAATVAVSIGRRELLPGESAEWLEEVRRELAAGTQRALECLAWVWTRRGDPSLAVAMAEQAVALDPFREPAWCALLDAHRAAGDRAGGTLAYERCRTLFERELGLAPGPALAAAARALDG